MRESKQEKNAHKKASNPYTRTKMHGVKNNNGQAMQKEEATEQKPHARSSKPLTNRVRRQRNGHLLSVFQQPEALFHRCGRNRHAIVAFFLRRCRRCFRRFSGSSEGTSRWQSTDQVHEATKAERMLLSSGSRCPVGEQLGQNSTDGAPTESVEPCENFERLNPVTPKVFVRNF